MDSDLIANENIYDILINDDEIEAQQKRVSDRQQ